MISRPTPCLSSEHHVPVGHQHSLTLKLIALDVILHRQQILECDTVAIGLPSGYGKTQTDAKIGVTAAVVARNIG